MAEESPTIPPITPSTMNQTKPARLNPHDIRNADLVNRFLAATPPYLYSPPTGPPNFFFSEMLRSLVQARANEQNSRLAANQFRRPRKRLWSQHRPVFDMNSSGLPATNSTDTTDRNSTPEKPLELTNKLSIGNSPPPSKSSETEEKSTSERPSKIVRNYSPPSVSGTVEPSTASLPPSDLVLPSAPPTLWYPHLYPPYGIDPLHFFIDLRVSSQAFDRKKENASPSTIDNNNSGSVVNLENSSLGKHRLGSAFSVPPRRDKSPLALNLSSATSPNIKTHVEFSNFDGDDKQSNATKNTNYVLQNLPRIYTTLNAHGGDDRQSIVSDENENRSENDFDAKDNEHLSSHSDDVVIVDQDAENENKFTRRGN